MVNALTKIFTSPLLLTWLLIYPALSPFLQPTLPRSADGLLHLYRVVALDAALQQGAIFPRWLPDLVYGYGLPLFVFYAPLAYYLTEFIHLLGVNFVWAVNLSSILALMVAASGTYLFVRDLLGARAGIVAAVAYIYAPYQLFNALSRGSLPAVWAAAIFPLAFWAFTRLRRNGTVSNLLLSGLLGALALLTHNISALLFFPLLAFYILLDLLLAWLKTEDSPVRFFGREVSPIAGTMLLALSLSAFFWLPAVIENSFVQIERVITPPDFDYHAHFVSLAALFSLPSAANTGLLNPDFPLTLGLAQVGLVIVGGGLIVLFRRVDALLRPITLFAGTSLLLLIFMMLPISVVIWDHLPLIAFVQHPHRLLGITAFLLAVLAGLTLSILPQRWQLSGAGIAIVTVFLFAIPLLYPRYYNPLPAAPTISGMHHYEQSIGAIGTTSFGEYLPLWVRQIPRESPLPYDSEWPLERLDTSYLPPNAQIERATYGLNQIDLTLSTPEPGQAVFHTFYFPGWQAWLDGDPVDITPLTERGLIGVQLPAGRHQLQLAFRETPIRRLANGISWVSLLIFFGLLTYAILSHWRRSSRQSPPPHSNPLPEESPLSEKSVSVKQREYIGSPLSQGEGLGVRGFSFLTLTALVLILAKTAYFDRYDSPLKHTFTGSQVAGATTPRLVNFGHQINLLGYDLDRQTVPAGAALNLTAYWQVRQPTQTDFSILAQIVDADNHLYAAQDNLHPGNLPTSRWEPWGFAKDPHLIPIPAGTPPGDYFLIIGPYHPLTWERFLVVEGGDVGWNDVVAIPVTITRPVQNPTIEELNIVWATSAPVNPESEIQLLGATPERSFLTRQDFLRVALFWQAMTPPTENYQIQLRLVDTAGETALQQISQPSHNRYPTPLWQPGERVRDNHALWIPANFLAGEYRLQVQLLDESDGVVLPWLEVGRLTLE